MYTPEQLRIAFEDVAKGYGWPLEMGDVAYLSSETEKLWQGFRWGVNCAATLRQSDSGRVGVTDKMVSQAVIAAGDYEVANKKRRMTIDESQVFWKGQMRAALEAALAAQGQGEKVDGDAPCAKCGSSSVDTGFECNDCGHDNALAASPAGVPDGWREDVALAAQMLTWGADEGLTESQARDVRAHQSKLFAMLAAAPSAPQGVDRG